MWGRGKAELPSITVVKRTDQEWKRTVATDRYISKSFSATCWPAKTSHSFPKSATGRSVPRKAGNTDCADFSVQFLRPSSSRSSTPKRRRGARLSFPPPCPTPMPADPVHYSHSSPGGVLHTWVPGLSCQKEKKRLSATV